MRNEEFVHCRATLPPREYVGITWVPHERFVLAQIVRSVVNEVRRLNVRCPSHCIEDVSLHVHAHSDRRVTVILTERIRTLAISRVKTTAPQRGIGMLFALIVIRDRA